MLPGRASAVRRCRIRPLLAAFGLLVAAFAAGAEEALPTGTTTRQAAPFGILAFRPKPETEARWQPLIEHLNQRNPANPVRLVVLHYPELDKAIQQKQVDFVLTQPAHYIQMAQREGLLSPLATLVEKNGTQPLSRFGGVIVTLAERKDIQQLADLRNRKIAASSTSSLGSYQAQAYELSRLGIRIPADAALVETGQPQDLAITALLSGKADAAFVRTGLIESMQREGKLPADKLRVLRPRSEKDFPFALSTRLYPEWPIAAMPWADAETARRVGATLLLLSAEDTAAQRAAIHGFDVPGDYRVVDDMLRELRLPPYDTPRPITLGDVVEHYGIPIAVGVVVVLGGLLAFIVALWRSNRRLREERSRTKAAMQRLAASETRFRGVFENVDALAIQGYRPDGTVAYWNHASQVIYGYTPEEAKGRLLFDLIIPPAMHDGVREAVRWMFTHKTGIPAGRLTLRRKDGLPVDVYSSHTVVDTEQGPLMFCLDIDLGALVKAEQALVDSEMRQRMILETVGEGIYGSDLNGTCTFINPAGLALLGMSEAEVIGHNTHTLFHHSRADGSPYPRTECPTSLTAQDGQTRHVEDVFWRKNDGCFPVRLTIAAQHQHGEICGLVVTFADISESARIARELETHRHHLEDEVRQRTEQLEIARQAAESASRSKSAFLANMSHEIRTPLNGILGMVHLLRRDHPTLEQLDRLDKIDAASQHLLAVINDVLDISKIEAGKLKLDAGKVDINALVKRVVSVLGENAKNKGLSLVVETDRFDHELIGDQTRLTQCLINYVGNAIKFTERGSVTIRVRRLHENAEECLLRFEVEDSGIGIPEPSIGRLFGIFEQADDSSSRKYGGTGLGLAITRRLAELMGGEVGVRSQEGAGSLFWFTARLQPGDEAQEALRSTFAGLTPALVQNNLAGHHLLVVEDEPINREIALELLSEFGLTADTADNGKHALDMVRRQNYDLVLMDMQMPEMDGLEATRCIRQLPQGADLPIIAMTANAFAEDRERCLEAGMNDFITKPIEPDELKLLLLHHLAR